MLETQNQINEVLTIPAYTAVNKTALTSSNDSSLPKYPNKLAPHYTWTIGAHYQKTRAYVNTARFG